MRTSEYAVWLYGSYARQDYDSFSDIDLFIAGKPDICEIKKYVEFDLSQISISQYEWTEIEAMAGYGSLFLQHLKLEGRPLIGNLMGNKRLADLLLNLCSYQHVYRDIRSFKQCINDVVLGIDRGSTPYFEISVIATVLRHSAVLASYIMGQPKFGRIEAFQYVAKVWGFEKYVIDEFQNIYQFRLHEDGRAPIPFEPSDSDVQLWVIRAKRFLAILEEEANAFQKRLLAAN